MKIIYRNAAIKIFPILILLSFVYEAEARRGWGGVAKMAGAVKSVGSAVKTYGRSTLTSDQLVKCLRSERELDSLVIQLTSESELVEMKVAKLNRIESDITGIKKYLNANKYADFTTQKEVDKYNKTLNTYNSLVDQYNSEISKYKKYEGGYNRNVDRHNELVADFSANCSGKYYYEDDMISAKSWLKNHPNSPNKSVNSQP